MDLPEQATQLIKQGKQQKSSKISLEPSFVCTRRLKMARSLAQRQPNNLILLKIKKTNPAIHVLSDVRTFFYVLSRIWKTNQKAVYPKHYIKVIQIAFNPSITPEFAVKQKREDTKITLFPKSAPAVARACHTFAPHHTFLPIQENPEQFRNSSNIERIGLPINKKSNITNLRPVLDFQNLNLHENIPIQSSPIWSITEPSGIHQNIETCHNMSQITRDTDGRMFGKFSDFGRVQKNMYVKCRAGIFKANRAPIQNQNREVFHYSNPIHKLLGNDHQLKVNNIGSASNVICIAVRTSNSKNASGVENPSALDKKKLNINTDYNQTSHEKINMVRAATKKLEWQLIYLISNTAVNIYGCQQQSTGNSD
ncbi:hypothetical protein BB561_002455 [Smittium simulii]|uniref:Uncharacterized protein n=1 Tax=Smittium simulii TaxID=133385 RepID=A0A2T9YQG9_9FUNG|nr:hypothetical protein BB561_002455 [Smittium simulii]